MYGKLTIPRNFNFALLLQNQFVQWINVIDSFIIDIFVIKTQWNMTVCFTFIQILDVILYLIRYDFTFVSILTKMFPGNIGKKLIYYTILKCYNTFKGGFILENSIESRLQFHFVSLNTHKSIVRYILFSLLESSPNMKWLFAG